MYKATEPVLIKGTAQATIKSNLLNFFLLPIIIITHHHHIYISIMFLRPSYKQVHIYQSRTPIYVNVIESTVRVSNTVRVMKSCTLSNSNGIGLHSLVAYYMIVTVGLCNQLC